MPEELGESWCGWSVGEGHGFGETLEAQDFAGGEKPLALMVSDEEPGDVVLEVDVGSAVTASEGGGSIGWLEVLVRLVFVQHMVRLVKV